MSWRDLNRRLGDPKFHIRWLRKLAYRKFLDWYRRSHFCESTASGILTPLEATFRHLELRGLSPNPLIALEVFGGTGLCKTVDLAHRCEHLTHFEIQEAVIHHAKKVLPKDKTTFLNQDSIQAVQQGNLPRKDYNLIHIDNPRGPFGSGYCENFDLFPEIVDCLGNCGILVLNVWLDIRDRDPDESWLNRRKEFFGLSDTDNAACIGYETAKAAYLAHVPKDRFSIGDVFPVPHHGETIYLVISLKRESAEKSRLCPKSHRTANLR